MQMVFLRIKRQEPRIKKGGRCWKVKGLESWKVGYTSLFEVQHSVFDILGGRSKLEGERFGKLEGCKVGYTSLFEIHHSVFDILGGRSKLEGERVGKLEGCKVVRLGTLHYSRFIIRCSIF
jgi:hypothetical protein